MAKLQKRKDGRYQSSVYLGKDDNGNKKYKVVYGDTIKDAEQKAAEIKSMYGKGIDVCAADETFGTWSKRFYAVKKAEGLGYSQLSNINTFIGHLAPICSMPLSKVQTAQIQAIINRLADWHDGKPPLAKRTLKYIVQNACAIFKMAIGQRVIEYNPAEYVVVPKNAEVTERTAIEPYQRQWVIDTEHNAKRIAMLMLFAGLRRGEAMTLTWCDVDLGAGTISVNKAVEFIGNAARVKSPKTKAGYRTVDMHPTLKIFLQQERRNDSYVLIVHKRDGSMLSKSGFATLWRSYIADLNIKYGYDGAASKHNPQGIPLRIQTFTAHQLRHTFCTMLYEAGYSVVEAKAQMGHADIQTTANIYTHLDKIAKKKTVSKLEIFAKENA